MLLTDGGRGGSHIIAVSMRLERRQGLPKLKVRRRRRRRRRRGSSSRSVAVSRQWGGSGSEEEEA
jgi:hypothetical protein